MYSMKNNIRMLREEKELKLRQLAAMIVPPMSHSQLQKLEAGERKLNPKWKKRIATALGCSEKDLVLENEMQKINGYSTLSSLSTVPIVGFINSEGIVELFDCDEDKIEKVLCPPRLNPKNTKGYRFFIHDEEWEAFVEEREPNKDGVQTEFVGVPDEFLKKFCKVTIFQKEGERTLFKFVYPGSATGYHDLRGMDSAQANLKDCTVKSSLLVKCMWPVEK